MILETGDKLLVVHRRLFGADAVRFFTCTVELYDAGVVRATGHSWIRDTIGGRMLRKHESSTKVLPLSSGNVLAYVLPATADMPTLEFEIDEAGGLWLTDCAGLRMDLREQWTE